MFLPFLSGGKKLSESCRCFHVAVVMLGALCLSGGIASSADIYGLVVGIDDYVGTDNDLAGAVNDARDINQALNKIGARKVVRFLNKDATKANISSAWFDLVKQAKAGDTIVFTFSGHGSQEQEPPGRNGEVDGKNENFLLAGFQPSGYYTKERIVDDELFAWTKVADDKGINVILVADSCHSGTMNRAVGITPVRYRQGKFSEITGDKLRYPDQKFAKITEKDLENVTFIGATSDDRLTPEVTIDGLFRGALSWSFARALEGKADVDRNGVVSQFELVTFVVAAVRMHVENQQSPQITPVRAAGVPMFPVLVENAFSGSQRAPQTGSIDGTERGGNVLRVAVSGGSFGLISKIPDIAEVTDHKQADIIWNVKEGTVRHPVGGIVAENVDASSIRPVIMKWRVLKELKSQSLVDPLKMELLKGNHRYRRLEEVEISVSDIRYPHITVFNLPPDGKVEYLQPLLDDKKGRKKDWTGKTYFKKFRVANPPYGAEHLVVIYSPKILSGLHSTLSQMKVPEDTKALQGLLKAALGKQKFQVGVLSIYTGK
ncbi:MAG: caspase family protein [Methyloligellaceae bacterium]